MLNCPLCSSPGDDLVFNFYCSNENCNNYRDKERKFIKYGEVNISPIFNKEPKCFNEVEENTDTDKLLHTQMLNRVIRKDILLNQSDLVNMLLGRELIDFGDIVNWYPDPYSFTDEEIKEASRYYGISLEGLDVENIRDDLADIMEPKEIFEWWAITDWLAGKLENVGEPILFSDYGTWWGRTCTGQSIELDGVIQKITENL